MTREEIELAARKYLEKICRPGLRFNSDVLALADEMQRQVNAALREQAKQLGPYWVCEEHPELAWPHDDCPGPGMPSSNRAQIIVELEAEVERLREHWNKQNEIIVEQQQQIADGRTIYEAAHAEIADLRAKLAHAEAEVERLKSEKTELTSVTTYFNAKLAEAERK